MMKHFVVVVEKPRKKKYYDNLEECEMHKERWLFQKRIELPRWRKKMEHERYLQQEWEGGFHFE